MPGVRWRDGNGKSKWVFLQAFQTSDVIWRARRRWNVAQLAKIVAWSAVDDES
ncbi:hypothetical protein [Cryobacterium sp. MLB-32]|uniref:hypothetical protein n=1 Tax=Cryobacterium sp. MLB-32 TaxID=1529318 RepID=UPI0012E0B404|nr:hypothetical protein [Cryobacterium sp. MLB-32]